MKDSLIPRIVCGVLLGVALTSGSTSAQTGTQAQGATPPQGRGRMGMMAERADEMAAADKRLDELVKALQSSTGQAKVDSLAAVVVELVAQHKAMHGRMASMMGTGAAQAAPEAPGVDPHKH